MASPVPNLFISMAKWSILVCDHGILIHNSVATETNRNITSEMCVLARFPNRRNDGRKRIWKTRMNAEVGCLEVAHAGDDASLCTRENGRPSHTGWTSQYSHDATVRCGINNPNTGNSDEWHRGAYGLVRVQADHVFQRVHCTRVRSDEWTSARTQ